jgi:GntR family transcriptional regulator of arabinose operon
MAKKKKKYELVYSYLRTFIDKNKFTLNSKLPSEHFLCSKFSVSRETVRTAIGILVKEGYVYALRGSGTYFDRIKAMGQNFLEEEHEYTIGFIAQGQDTDAVKHIVSGIRDELKYEDVYIKIFMTDNKYSNERKCLEACSSGFDGLIVDGVKANLLDTNLDSYNALYDKNVRVLFYNNFYHQQKFPKVIIDDAKCADELIRRLTDRGHRRIAGIFVYDNYQGIEKYKGYVRSMHTYGGHFDDDMVKWFISDEMLDQKIFKESIGRFIDQVSDHATAVVCCNYMILNLVSEHLASRGKTVPDDLSLVGFDYSDDDWNTRGITSSIHPSYRMGQKLGRTMMSMVRDSDYKSRDYSYTFPPTMFDGISIKDLKNN